MGLEVGVRVGWLGLGVGASDGFGGVVCGLARMTVLSCCWCLSVCLGGFDCDLRGWWF